MVHVQKNNTYTSMLQPSQLSQNSMIRSANRCSSSEPPACSFAIIALKLQKSAVSMATRERGIETIGDSMFVVRSFGKLHLLTIESDAWEDVLA